MRTFLCIFVAALCMNAIAQTYDTNGVNVTLFAGSGFSGLVDGQGAQTMFNNPVSMTSDSSSNLWVVDRGNVAVRKITPAGLVSTFEQGGILQNFSGNLDCITIDKSGELWIAADYNNAFALYSSNNGWNYLDMRTMPGVSSRSTFGTCWDSLGRLYFADATGSKIYTADTNFSYSVFAGSGNSGSIDGNGIFTSFNFPTCLAIDKSDNIYVWESGGGHIRRINQNRDVLTVAGVSGYNNSDGIGTNVVFQTINGMCCDPQGNLYLACDTSIRKLSPALEVTTLAGSFTERGYTNGSGSVARFNGASGICCVNGSIFVSETGNQRIRRITMQPQAPLTNSASLTIGTYPGIQMSGMIGRTYNVQSSADMTNWLDRATVALTNSSQLWIDQQPIAGNKFYRALLVP